MRRISGVLLIVFMLVFLVYSNGLAALYSQTEVPEDSSFLRFEFLAVESSDGTDGFVTVEARGDYFERGEGIDLYIEGNDTTAKFAVEGIYFSMGDPQIIQWVDNGDPDDVWWTNTWTIPGATMASIVNDDNNISVNFVDLFWNYDV
ncbi:MAG: hypothetical protein QNJ22_19025, partial [Desulfosarcinaceae bacterium]|nr:hypothetical protein [Desulfosarcinaceae bacterium]